MNRNSNEYRIHFRMNLDRDGFLPMWSVRLSQGLKPGNIVDRNENDEPQQKDDTNLLDGQFDP